MLSSGGGLRFGIPARPSLNMRFIPLQYMINIVVRGDSEPIPHILSSEDNDAIYYLQKIIMSYTIFRR